MRSDSAIFRSASADLFVLGLRLSGRHCLLVGSGEELGPRIQALVAADARVSVVSERPPESVRALARSGAITLFERPFEEADLEGVWLAVSTDLDAALAVRMFRATEERRIFFCAVDQPDFCSFSHLAIARVSDVTVAVSTSGRAPALARRLREEIGRLLAESALGPFVERLAALRERTASADRRHVLGAAVTGVRITGSLELPQNDVDVDVEEGEDEDEDV